MASIVVSGDTSGAVTLAAPAVAGTTTLTLPTTSGTVLTTASTTGVNASAISTGTLAQAYGGTGTTTGYYGFKNRIINGAMVIDQRNAGASVSPITTSLVFPVDRWKIPVSQNSKLTAQQNAGSVTPPAGFTNYVGITSSSAYSITSTDFFVLRQSIEGFNVADLGWGTANAKTVTLSFWVRSSLTGTFGGSLTNNDGSRSYPFSYTISSENTWEQKSITIIGETNGTWLSGNLNAINVDFALGVGSTYSGTAGSWSSSLFLSATGAVSVVGTNGATFYITGVQLEVGSNATSFDYRPYGTELALCQRYYQKSYNIETAPGTVTNVGYFLSFCHNAFTLQQTNLRLPVSMRASPTITLYSPNNGASGVVYEVNSAVNRTCGVLNTGQLGGEINASGNFVAGTYVIFHYVAAIEL